MKDKMEKVAPKLKLEDKINELAHVLLKKEKKEKKIVGTIKSSSSPSQEPNQKAATLPHHADFKSIKTKLSQMNASLVSLSNEQIKTNELLESSLNVLQARLQQVTAEHGAICEKYEAINQARLRVIAEQKEIIKIYQLRSITKWLKYLLRPKIGVLYHYQPRLLRIPKKYARPISLKKTPTISIVTPSYNQGDFLTKTIASVVEQNYPALQYVIQDGGSKDHSCEVIKRHEAHLLHWESKPDEGQSQAINLGFKHTSGEIMAYLNSDDVLMPGTLSYVAHYFETHPEIDVVYGHRVIIDEYDQEVGRWVLPQHDSTVLTWADFVPQETLFWRRRIWDKVGGKVDESFRFAMDWDLLLRFKEAGATFKRLPRFLGGFRIHPHQKTSAAMEEIGTKEMQRLRERCHGREVTQLEIKKNIMSYFAKHLMLNTLYRLGLLRY